MCESKDVDGFVFKLFLRNLTSQKKISIFNQLLITETNVYYDIKLPNKNKTISAKMISKF